MDELIDKLKKEVIEQLNLEDINPEDINPDSPCLVKGWVLIQSMHSN